MRFSGFEFKPSVVPSVAFGAVMVVLLSLGTWQLDRADQKRVLLEARDARGERPPLDLNLAVMPKVDDRYRAAVVKGRYVTDQQWLLDNRVLKGRAGYHVYTLLETTGPRPRALLVNRGWVDTGPSRSLLPDLPAPEGVVELSGRLDQPESVGLKLENDQLSSIASVVVLQHLEIAELAAQVDRNLLGLALVLDEGQAGLFQRDWSRTLGMTPQKHVGYAVQWFALAVALSIIYVGVNTRRVDAGKQDNHVAG